MKQNMGGFPKLLTFFSYVVSIIKPEWGATAATVSYFLKKTDKRIKGEPKEPKEGSGMRGGRRRSTLNGFSSQKEKMAWVRSFIGKKKRSGSGYRRRRSDVSSIRALKPSARIKGYAGLERGKEDIEDMVEVKVLFTDLMG